jgi:serine/threonine protein kinase
MARPRSARSTVREIASLRELDHPHIVQLWDVAYVAAPTRRIYLVFECLATDLQEVLLKQDGEPLPAPRVRVLSRQLLQALAYLHERGFLHRDVKPPNVLLDASLAVAKLADFGLARNLGLLPGRPRTPDLVTLWYRPPEILYGDPNYTSAVDLWSLGCVVAEMLTCCALFRGDSNIDQQCNFVRILGPPALAEWPELAHFPRGPYSAEGHVPPASPAPPLTLRALLPPSTPPDVFQLVSALLVYNPAGRPSAALALERLAQSADDELAAK